MKEELKVTSAEEYAQLANSASAADEKGILHKVKKTGAVFRVRHVDMQALIIVGALPMSLVEAAQDVLPSKASAPGTRLGVEEDGPDATEAPSREDAVEGSSIAIFMRQTVVDNVLEPRLGLNEAGRVSVLDREGVPVRPIDTDDFMELFGVITGGEAADGLKSFRKRKPRRTSTAERRRRKVRA